MPIAARSLPVDRFPMLAGQVRCSTGFTAAPAPATARLLRMSVPRRRGPVEPADVAPAAPPPAPVYMDKTGRKPLPPGPQAVMQLLERYAAAGDRLPITAEMLADIAEITDRVRKPEVLIWAIKSCETHGHLREWHADGAVRIGRPRPRVIRLLRTGQYLRSDGAPADLVLA